MKYIFLIFLSISFSSCTKEKVSNEIPKVIPAEKELEVTDKEDCDEKAKKQLEKVKNLDLSKSDEGCTIE